MNPTLKECLTVFSGCVAEAIARNENGKDVDWRGVMRAQEKLCMALDLEPCAVPSNRPQAPRAEDGKYAGPPLKLRYTDATRLTVLYLIEMSDGYSVEVVGNPEDGSYEWVLFREGKLEHSDCGYGDSDIALRDGLIAMHGLPDAAVILSPVAPNPESKRIP